MKLRQLLDDYGLIAFAVALFLFLALFICDRVFARGGLEMDAVVLERKHAASSVHTGTAVSDGKVILVTTTSPEKWSVIVEIEGTAFECATDSQTWAQLEKRNKVTAQQIKGRFSGIIYGLRIVQ